MAKWRVVNHDNLSERPVETPARPGSWRRWLLLLGGIVLFLSGAAFFTLRRYRLEGQAALREDLTAYIFEEETRRYMGRPDASLLMPGLPPAWAEAYWRSFKREEAAAPPGPIRLVEVDFDGQCALATLELEGNKEIRAYCLKNQRWYRAPVLAAAWGHEQPPLELSNRMRLHFRARDQLFAEMLANDLASFFEHVAQLSGRPTLLAEPVEIIIEPHDLQGPLLSAEPQRITLNSPWLVSLQEEEESGLSGEAAVRLALARLLLQREELPSLALISGLPGAHRFREAAQTILAAHLLLPPEAQELLVERWRARLGGQWVSPFFAELLATQTPTTTFQAETAARLMADYIYRSISPEALSLTTQQLPGPNSWDRVFQAALQRSLLKLEHEAALYAQVPLEDTPPVILDNPAHLPATLLRFDKPISQSLKAYVQLSGRTGPTLVEIPAGMTFQTPDGDALPAGCIGPGARLEISGDWLEAPWRLQATKVEVEDIELLTIDPAPADTVAYLTAGPSYDPQALLALKHEGGLELLTPLSPTLQVFPLPVATAEQAVHFLFRLDLPACHGVWFGRYEPGKGVTGYWLAPPEPLQWVWRADKQDLVFFGSEDDKATYDVYISDKDFIPEAVGKLTDPPSAFVGWHVKTGQLVFYAFDFNATAIGLFDLRARVPTFQSYYLLLRGRRLSPNGNWLASISSGRRPDLVPDRLELIDLTNDSITVPFRVRIREGVTPPVWSLYMAQPRLAILAGPATDDQPLPLPTRLVILAPDQQTPPLLVAQAAAGETLDSPVFCADGGLLYLAKSAGHYRLLSQAPGQEAQLLFSSDQPFSPVACP